MAKFCINCGAGLDEAAKFCPGCGTQTVAAATPPAPVPEPYPQPYPQYPQPAAQPYAPMAETRPKKKRTGLIIALSVFGGLAALVALIIVVAASTVSKAAKADYYEIGGDRIPSIKLALGETRKLTGTQASIENGVAMKQYTYAEPGRDQALEMSAYLTYLREKDGFLLLTDAAFTVPEAWCKLGRNAAGEGYIIVVQIEYDRSGYIITLVREPGEITPNTPEVPVLSNDPFDPFDDEYLGEGDDDIDIYGLSYDGQEMWRNEDEDGVEWIFLDDDGTFSVSTFWKGSGNQHDEMFGTYSIKNGKLFLYNLQDEEGQAYDDMTFNCKVDGDVMTLDGDLYYRVADRDRPDVLADPFMPYPKN